VRSIGAARGLAITGALALALAACSSSNGDGEAADGRDGYAAADGGCAAAAGLSGPIEDRGTAKAAGGAITLDATEFAFSPTCVEAGAGETIEVTITNSGSALHNLSVESIGIDQGRPGRRDDQRRGGAAGLRLGPLHLQVPRGERHAWSLRDPLKRRT